MGDKTSDESDDEFAPKTSDRSDIEERERVKDSSLIMDSSGDESDNDKLEELFIELRTSSVQRPSGFIPPSRKSSLMAKITEIRNHNLQFFIIFQIFWAFRRQESWKNLFI